MQQTLNYNIHNVLKFKITRDKKRDFMRDLNLPFSFFEVGEVDKPDITLNIGEFTPSNKGCYVIEHKYYVKENYLYGKDSKGKASWEVEIFGLEQGDTTINFNGKSLGTEAIWFPDLLPQSFLLKPLIEYKLNRKGYLFIHSAAIARNGQAYLLAGRNGAFKSTLVMDFVRKAGFEYVGEDRIILGKDKVLSFPMSLLTLEFKVENLLTENFQNFWQRIRLVRYLRSNPKYTNCHIPVAQSATPEALFFIARSNKQEISQRGLKLEEAVSKLVANNRAEMLLEQFLKYMLVYSFVFPNSQLARYWNEMERNLAATLEKIPTYEIEIPREYSTDVFNKVHHNLISDSPATLS